MARFRLEARLTLKAKLGGDPERAAALFPDKLKALGGSHLHVLPAGEREGLLRRAVARGTLVRLRSVLLTSGTTIVGLLPLLIRIKHVPWKLSWLFGLELPWTLRWMDTDNQDIWQNLALTSVGGLVSSTVLIILTIPALYYMSVRMGWGFRRLGVWRSGSVLIGFLLIATAVMARGFEIESVADLTVALGVDTLGRLAESIGPITVSRLMVLLGALTLLAGAAPVFERWRSTRRIMAFNEVFMAVLLAACATGAWRTLEDPQRWILFASYAVLAAWALRSSFEHLRPREGAAPAPTRTGGPDAPAAA